MSTATNTPASDMYIHNEDSNGGACLRSFAFSDGISLITICRRTSGIIV